MKIQFKPLPRTHSYSKFDQENGKLFAGLLYVENQDSNTEDESNLHHLCDFFLTPGILFITFLSSFFSLWLLWHFVTLEKFKLLGTFQFADNSTANYEVQISWLNCGNEDFGKLEDFAVEPSPINFEKNFTLNVDAEIFKNIDSPISLKVKVYKKFWIQWVPIPCVSSIGSCSYKNICSYSPYPNNTTCVLPNSSSLLPCNCPIKKGKYFAHKSLIHVNDPFRYIPEWLKDGEYRVRVEGFSHGAKLGCYKFHFAMRS